MDLVSCRKNVYQQNLGLIQPTAQDFSPSISILAEKLHFLGKERSAIPIL